MASFKSIFPLWRLLSRSFCSVFALISLSSSLTAATPRAIASKPAPDRDHHLFVGLDLLVPLGTDYVPVRKIVGKEALVDSQTGDRIHLGDTPRFRLKMATKVSGNSASISKLKHEETYSAGNDPQMNAMMDQARVQMVMADQVDEAEQKLSSADLRAANAENAMAADPEGGRGFAYEDTPEGIIEMANTGFEDALAIQDNMMDVLTFGINDDEDTNYDALRVSFEVSSTYPMADAIAVLLVRVEHEHELSDFTVYQQVGLVNQKPRRVRFYHEGFPPGFKVKETRVFLYNHGEEVATNHSEKHYRLTSSEAREFVQLDHQGRHRRDTVPAEPAWSLAPPVLQATETPQDYNYDVTVELDATGNLIAIQTADQIIPEKVQAAIRQTTFVPALEKGKPVPSTLVVNPSTFFKE